MLLREGHVNFNSVEMRPECCFGRQYKRKNVFNKPGYKGETIFSTKLSLCEGAFLTPVCDPGAEYVRACAKKEKEHGVLFYVHLLILFVYKARFKRRILHARNRIAKLSAFKMRRLNQLNATYFNSMRVSRIFD